MVVTGSNDGTARLWSADTRAHLRTLNQGGAVHSVGFSCFGTEVLTASGSGVRLWDAGSGNSVWNGPTGGAYYLATGALSPSSRLVETLGGDGYCRILDAATGILARDWFAVVEGASGVFFSAGDSRLLTTDAAMT
jgi:WD40 repeat protein